VPTATARRIEKLARTRLGKRYAWGAQGPHRFDCSGFTWWVFNAAGIPFGRASTFTDWKSGIGPAWKRGRAYTGLRAGDLAYLRPGTRGPQHVGIYIGRGRLIHASSAAGRVVISDMAGGYHRSAFVGFLRHRGVRR
jgi:cell wall-associated NlpC family hydrolase